MTMQEWAERALIRKGAASVCHHHGFIIAGKKTSAVWAAVALARKEPPEKISADGAELIILEKYLALPKVCPGCVA